MASKTITAILWTLVSVNILTLVVGGLITWLGYAIPIRLKQFGLLPELVVVAGFSSLVVACLGLCALNYSSHYALNVYAISCCLFVLLLVLGIPEAWYKSDHFSSDNLLMNIIYFALLFLLLVLLAFAFTFANYLRRHELQDNPEQAHSDHPYPQRHQLHYHHPDHNNNNDNNNPIGTNLISALGPSVLAGTCTCAAGKSAFMMENTNNGDQMVEQGLQTVGHTIRARDKWLTDTFNSSSSTYNTIQHHKHHRYQAADLCASMRDSAQLCSSFNQRQAQVANKHDKAANYNELHNKNNSEGVGAPMLTSKGFYRHISSADGASESPQGSKDANMMRTNSCTRPLNDAEPAITSTKPDCLRQYDKLSRYQQVIAPTLHGSLDDTFIEYYDKQTTNLPPTNRISAMMDNGHYRSSTLGRCRCLHLPLSNGSSLVTRLNSSYSMLDRYPRPLDSTALYTMPTYIAPTSVQCGKGRSNKPRASKSSSSVMAITAAAAAALLAGVTDTSSLVQPDDDTTYGDMFGAPGQELSENNISCDGLDNNDPHLNTSMLNVSCTSEAFRQSNVCRKPVLDFAALLDIRK